MAEEKVNFKDAVMECLANDEFCREYDRIMGDHICTVRTATGINAMIDEATGFAEAEMKKFTAFVFLYVWMPLFEGEKDV